MALLFRGRRINTVYTCSVILGIIPDQLERKSSQSFLLASIILLNPTGLSWSAVAIPLDTASLHAHHPRKPNATTIATHTPFRETSLPRRLYIDNNPRTGFIWPLRRITNTDQSPIPPRAASSPRSARHGLATCPDQTLSGTGFSESCWMTSVAGGRRLVAPMLTTVQRASWAMVYGKIVLETYF